ncbi:pro-corazonin-like [Anopheles maculipalpis]|uniref:pro-corazonin-like n=1 Tax=Anopheles maculipalpis TaxID=1496333 RepID=UPI002158EC54|nr:pro-corazonin-like [Anopheles maculipalpis]
MPHTRTIALLLVGLVVLVNAQTFQYSRGWTNGKRSSSVEPVANQGLVSGMSPGAPSALKPNEKTLLRRFLRNPCDSRIASLFAGHPSKDTFQLASNNYDSSEAAGSAFILPQFLMDPDEGNGNGGIGGNLANGRPVEDELRFKRGVSSGISDPRQKNA